jgi:hypothetical protein
MAVVDFTDFRASRRWLEGQPHEVAMTIAARAALRALPLIVEARITTGFGASIVLPCFRTTAVPWAAAKHPARGREIQAAARAAAHTNAPTDAAAAARAATFAAATTRADATARDATRADRDRTAADDDAARAVPPLHDRL